MLETDKSGEATPSKSLPEGVTSERLLEWLDGMLLIRYFETESVRLSLAGKIPGGIHSSEGQEAVAVGTMAALGRSWLSCSARRPA
jgi:TPP-dependent pyruvate/acetoin dehydrogenase alpha subunit